MTIHKFIALTTFTASLVLAQERLAAIPPDKQTDEQKATVKQMVGQFPINGPFAAFLRDPQWPSAPINWPSTFANQNYWA